MHCCLFDLFTRPSRSRRYSIRSCKKRDARRKSSYLDAGFEAGQLYYNRFFRPSYDDEDLTAGELAWDAAYASFKPEQLRKAGCTEMELQCAGFSSEDLLEAVYIENKLPRVVPAKAMPRPPIRKTCAISAKRMPRRKCSATVRDDLSASFNVSI